MSCDQAAMLFFAYIYLKCPGIYASSIAEISTLKKEIGNCNWLEF